MTADRPPAPERVRWYCHSCGFTHEHTPEQRDAHRDDLRRREAWLIDARRRGKAPGGP